MYIYVYMHIALKIAQSMELRETQLTRSSATAEIARDADETAVQGHSRSSVVVPIDAACDFM